MSSGAYPSPSLFALVYYINMKAALDGLEAQGIARRRLGRRQPCADAHARAFVGGVARGDPRVSPIGARRAARAAAEQELASELEPGESVLGRAYVSQRNWSDNFRESFGVLAATDRRLLYVGLPPAPWISRMAEGPPELRAQSFAYDAPFVAEARRLFGGLTRGVLVKTTAGDVVQREVTGLLGDDRVDHHLEQQVAELVAQRGRVARLDRLDDLLRLLPHVGDQRGVGLLPLPGALALEDPHLVGEVLHRRAPGSRGGHGLSRSGG